MTERRGTKALELWCRRITDGYPGVNVQNMTTSWRDGLAFCAMIHHFRPDLIDFNSLNKDDVYGNNELAFRTAAEHLGIPALLDAEDMASCSVPDRLSILTYLSQFYQSFGGSSPSRLALSRTKESSNEGITPVPESTTPKVGPRMGMRRDPCAVCGMPVFLAEKLVISRTPYHRTCFRCARCKNQLTPGNYYETEEGQYCCETCPDEETESPMLEQTLYHESNREAMLLINEQRENVKPSQVLYARSLSDEEKSSHHRARFEEKTKNSPQEAANDEISSPERRKNSQMRMSFMTENFLAKNSEDRATDASRHNESKENDSIATSIIEDDTKQEGDRREPKGTLTPSWVIAENVTLTKTPMPSPTTPKYQTIYTDKKNISPLSDSTNDTLKGANKNKSLNQLELIINDYDKMEDTRIISLSSSSPSPSPSSLITDTANHERTNNSNNINMPDASSAAVADSDDCKNSTRPNTKDTIGPNTDTDSLSLVQKRLKLFETRNVQDFVKNSSLVVSSSSHNSRHEVINDSTVTNVDGQVDCNALETRPETEETPSSSTIEQDKSLTDPVVPVFPPSLHLSGQENKITSPPVPKRSNHKQSRKIKDSETKNVDVTVLNASGIDLSENEENYPSDLNPFDCDDLNNDDEQLPYKNQPRSSEDHKNNEEPRVSTNPFGSSDDEEDDREDGRVSAAAAPPRPATRNIYKTSENLGHEAPAKRRLKAPQINFNPFLSDEEDERETDDEDESLRHSSNANTPVPKPRTINRHTADTLLSPWKHDLTRGDIYASNSSLASTGSTSTTGGGTCRKKKHAPPPPVAKELFASPGDSLGSTNSLPNGNNSLRSTPKARKAKPAPPPPLPTNIAISDSPIIHNETRKDPKNDKDAANRTTQNMANVSSDDTNPYDSFTDKSVQGKWKRKKGPAPARPIPHRRKIKVMSLKDVKLELDEIEMQQQGLERQGVRLEQLIRDKAETGSAAEDANLGLDVEELVLELFALVNEKNELFRRQAELMLLRRQQRLEEEHADIEYQIRCLLCQPEATKTDFDKQREETLIQRLVEIVERRNEIVECLEMDRRREVEEDRSINTQMGIYAAKNKGDFAKEVEEQLDEDERNRSKKSKKTKLKEKAKEKILRKVQKKDADKDVDETEVKLKRQNKKKWF